MVEIDKQCTYMYCENVTLRNTDASNKLGKVYQYQCFQVGVLRGDTHLGTYSSLQNDTIAVEKITIKITV
jgi:hypothetical protein